MAPADAGAPIGPGRAALVPASGPLTVTSFSASPSSILRSNTTWLNATVTGGTPPYTYANSGLPYGCQSLNGSSVPCIPGATGKFTIELQVTDIVGDAAWGNASLTVANGYGLSPTVTSFSADPAKIQLGGSTSISVIAVSHSSTPSAFLTLNYFDLPPGCASFNETPLVCLPTAAGTYSIEVEVIDGFGDYAYDSLTLVVEGSGSSGGGGTSLPLWAYAGLAALVAVVVGAAVVTIRRRR